MIILATSTLALWLSATTPSPAEESKQAEDTTQGRSQNFAISEDVRLNSRVYGNGPPIVLLPGLGGSGIEQFQRLGPILGRSGYKAVLLDPRGIGNSVGPLESLTLHDLAADVAAVIEELDLGPAVVLGRAFGNRVARCVAADRPDLVRAVILIAAGGAVPMSDEFRPDFQRLFSAAQLSEQERLVLLERTMFAAGNDPKLWLGLSFDPTVGAAHADAGRSTAREDWWTAGQASVLIVQGLEDRVAVPENGRLLKEELGNRAELVEVPGAGHALIVERPNEVASAILEYLDAMD